MLTARARPLTASDMCHRILDIERVLAGEIEIEAMDSHNNWCVRIVSHAHQDPRLCTCWAADHALQVAGDSSTLSG
jgi:hypothetical protein